jgi:hypothetical protein
VHRLGAKGARPARPHDRDWIGCAIWGIYLTHLVARSEDRAHILAVVDPDAIPLGVLTFAWLNDHASIAIANREPLAPFLQPMLDTASAIDEDFWRLCWWAQMLLWPSSPTTFTSWPSCGDLLSADPARGMLPAVEGMVAYFECFYLAAVGDATARDHFEHACQVGAECGLSTLEQLADSAQVPLLIDAEPGEPTVRTEHTRANNGP